MDSQEINALQSNLNNLNYKIDTNSIDKLANETAFKSETGSNQGTMFYVNFQRKLQKSRKLNYKK